MGERALGLGLRLLSIALFLGPIVAAFAAHGWSWRATLVPEQQDLEVLKEGFTHNVRAIQNLMEALENASIERVSELELEVAVPITSTFDTSIKLGGLSGRIFCHTHPEVELGRFKLKGKVEIPPHGSRVVEVVLRFTPQGRAHLEVKHPGEGWVFVNVENLEVEIWGITLEPPEELIGLKVPVG